MYLYIIVIIMIDNTMTTWGNQTKTGNSINYKWVMMKDLNVL